MKTLKAALLAAALCASQAQAEWLQYSKTPDMNVYVDPDTLRTSGDTRRIWVISDLKRRHKDGELSRRSQYEYHCADESFRILYLSTHSGPMAGGSTLWSGKGSATWTPIPPGTAASQLLEFVCR